MRSRSGRLSRVGARGEARPGCILFLLLVAVATYVGVVFIGSEFDYRSLGTESRRQAGLAAESSDDEIRGAIQEKARSLELPEAAQTVGVRRLPGNRINVLIRYADTLTFVGGLEWIRPREVRIEGSY